MDNLEKCQSSLNKMMEYSFDLESQLIMKDEEMLQKQRFDRVTGVLNNSALIESLKSNLNRAYFLLNMDNFSNINSAYGFDIGDEVLFEVSQLLNIVKPNDFELYRYCSDRFVLVSQNIKSNNELKVIAESIISFFNASDIMIDDEIPIPVSFSIGISKAKGLSAITQAEQAIKEIRHSRRNYYYIYDQKLERLDLQQENVYWINKIRESIVEDEIVVFFQPIYNNHTKKIEKYECLSRVYDEGTFVSPFSFMEAAIQTKVLHLMTQSVIEQACRKFSNTQYEFSVNITKDDLFMNYLNEFLLKTCVKYNIDPSRIVLEILEDITSISENIILEQLNLFRESGFQVAIDDFGAENSNFSRLLEFKPDYLKIDGAFIKDIVTDKNSHLITESITHICKKSGIKVIAEYIHNQDVLDVVTEIGIDYSQGYYIGAPSQDLVKQ